MAENYLKWSCNYRKFLKILSSKGEYRERLGHKLNSTWCLHITLHRRNISGGSYYPFWCFNLERESLDERVTVTVRLISNTIVYFDQELCFAYGEATKRLGNFDYTDNKNNDLVHIIFLFEQEKKSEKSPEEDTTLFETSNLKEDLLTLLHKGHLADVTLKCGAETSTAHKAILCARSPVFEAMFGNEMQESTTNVVTIEDMDVSVFRAWIHFVYGDEVKKASVDFACHLLDSAEKYQMKGLKGICMKYLNSVISIENAVKLLEVANLYDSQLKADVISYIADNFSDLKQSEEWICLKSRNPVLALEVYSYEDQ